MDGKFIVDCQQGFTQKGARFKQFKMSIFFLLISTNFYNSNVLFRMLSQKRKENININTKNKSQISKPYSVLSLGLLQRPGSQMLQRNWEKTQNKPQPLITMPAHNYNNKDYPQKSSSSPENRRKEQQEHPVIITSERNCHDNFKMFQASSDKVVMQPQEPLQDDIIFTHQKMVLQNITNKTSNEEQLKIFSNKQNNSFLANEDKNQCKSKGEHLVINLKKKIKKVSKDIKFYSKCPSLSSEIRIEPEMPLESLSQRQTIAANHQRMLNNPFLDSQVIPDASIYRNRIINQRIDNDIDTDDEQLQSSIKRLHRFLLEGVQQNQKQEKSSPSPIYF